MTEGVILKAVMVCASRLMDTLFRNNVGMGWAGRSKRLRPGEVITARGGEVLVFDPRPLHAGLIAGSGDGIGWHTIVITPEMIGRKVAVFLSAETKTATGRMTEPQKIWQRNVTQAGGIAVVCRSALEYAEAIASYRPPVA